MTVNYQIFEIADDGTLVELRDEMDNARYEYGTKEQALRHIESLPEYKPYVVVEKYLRDWTILDDAKESGLTGI